VAASVIVELAARKFMLPSECPCCGAPPDTEVNVRSSATGQVLGFPYCERCVAHVRKWDASGVASAGVMVLAILVALALAVMTTILVGLGVFVVASSLAWWLRSARRAAAHAACGVSCASPGLAVTYQGWTGTTSSFAFASPTFAARFAEANAALLANQSQQLRKLLDGYKRARLAVPTPAVAAGVAPPPLTAREWIARIEATTGVVARRVALQRALEMIEEPQPRRELIQTVARIELAPLLDKLQRESSPAAKRVLLAAAIEHIATDNIPDELQAALLEKLEARVAELAV
jgi:hypothetical protein